MVNGIGAFAHEKGPLPEGAWVLPS